MPLQTTCLGAYPKPEYLPLKDWFETKPGGALSYGDLTRQANAVRRQQDDETEALFVKATKEAVEDQLAAGIDIPTDGEQRRENYIHYHCRHLEGFDFENLTTRVLRDGAYEAELPTIHGRITPKGDHFLDRDFDIAQSFSDRPVKLTVPGPMTIMDTCSNVFYEDERQLAFDLADALNFEIRALADAGCTHIQVDEPLFARNVERALNYGIVCLERCFDGVPDTVTRIMHMCCGYPGHLDDGGYHKADPSCYFRLAGGLDGSCIDQISIEDAHRHNDLALLEKFQNSTVIFGAVAIAKSRVEPSEEIAKRLTQALCHIDQDRLIAAPDCGLGMLDRDLAVRKLKNLCEAAKQV